MNSTISLDSVRVNYNIFENDWLHNISIRNCSKNPLSLVLVFPFTFLFIYPCTWQHNAVSWTVHQTETRSYVLQKLLQAIHQILQTEKRKKEKFLLSQKKKKRLKKLIEKYIYIYIFYSDTLRRTTFLIARIRPGMRHCTSVISCLRE